MDPPGLGVPLEKSVKARLVDRNLAPFESSDSIGFLINAGHAPAEFCKAGG